MFCLRTYADGLRVCVLELYVRGLVPTVSGRLLILICSCCVVAGCNSVSNARRPVLMACFFFLVAFLIRYLAVMLLVGTPAGLSRRLAPLLFFFATRMLL